MGLLLRTASYFVILLAFAAAIGILIFTFLQIGIYDSNNYVQNVEGKYVKFCDANPLMQHIPFRITQNFWEMDLSLNCGWRNTNSAVRVLTSIIVVIICCMGFYGLIKNSRSMIICISIFSMLSAIGIFIAMILDAVSVIDATGYCTNGMPGFWLNDKKPEYTCDFKNFIYTILMDLGAFLIFILMGVILWMNRNNQSVSITTTSSADTDSEKLITNSSTIKKDPKDTNPFH